MPRLCSYTTLCMARVATSRGTRLPYLGYHSSRKNQRSLAGILLKSRLSPGLRGTHTRPPSPRADSDIRRNLSSPGIDVGCTWMNSPLAYSDAAGRDYDRLGREDGDFHAAQVHRADTAANAAVIDDTGEKLPALVLGDLALGLVAPHLLIERVQKLL